MHTEKKILVVGTTSDYIDIIRRLCKGGVFFITEPEIRSGAFEQTPDEEEEVVSEFYDTSLLLSNLENHISHYNIELVGVAAFDCESLEIASFIARKYGLPFTSEESVRNSRDKYISKELWKKSNIDTPDASIVVSTDEVTNFCNKIRNQIVLKPRTGAGSELVFLCNTASEAIIAFRKISEQLKMKSCSRLYDCKSSADYKIIAEEYIDAQEYSADFIVRHGLVEIIRFTRKIKKKGNIFGITVGYLLMNSPPDGVSDYEIKEVFSRNCKALGIDNAICMMDFFVRHGKIYLLETAPRPGGDCLPFLLEKATGLNIIKMNLELSAGNNIRLPGYTGYRQHIGIRIISEKPGILKKVDVSEIENDNNVIDISINRKPGTEILVPPDNYDLWILGHVIVRRDKACSPEKQVDEILGKIKIDIAY